MTPRCTETRSVESSERDCCVGCATAAGEDVDALERLVRTLTMLAHVHGILMRLRDRVAVSADASEVEK